MFYGLLNHANLTLFFDFIDFFNYVSSFLLLVGLYVADSLSQINLQDSFSSTSSCIFHDLSSSLN